MIIVTIKSYNIYKTVVSLYQQSFGSRMPTDTKI